MRDIWSFLLQTLTASGAAALVLALKALFHDKLSPRWQFGVWSVLAMVLVIPAGMGGRYVLFNWPFCVEFLRSALTGEYGALARVTVPFPIPALTAPTTWEEWMFALYTLGVAFFLARYGVSYLRLRLALRGSRPAREDQVREIAQRYELPVCPAVEAEGLTTAFVCGACRPVLVLPAGTVTNDKVILHELLHLENKDVLWGLVICLFRCIHWCNPLLWYCANRAGNDLEAMCDQRVLERLEGEERRNYGRILLEMADERYASAPGTSSMANGGKNIRRRIEAIARFKKYPAGMGLVSVCILLVLALPLAMGVRAESQRAEDHFGSRPADMAYARTVRCTTFGGALDAYAKAAITGRLDYRAMCAPLSEQNGLAEQWDQAEFGVQGAKTYQYYNLFQVKEGVYEGALVLKLEEDAFAAQTVRTEQEGDRWVVQPLDDFSIRGILPRKTYEARWGDFVFRLDWWAIYDGSGYKLGSTPLTPEPDRITWADHNYEMTVRCTGSPPYSTIAVSGEPNWCGEERSKLRRPETQDGEGTSSTGFTQWGRRTLEGDWPESFRLFGVETGAGMEYRIPETYEADIYINDELAAELTLLPVEGGD